MRPGPFGAEMNYALAVFARRVHHWFWVLAVGLGLHVGARVAPAQTPPKAVCSAGELRARLQEAQQLLRSLHVVYRAEGESLGDDAPPGLYVRREIVVKAPCSLFHHGTHGHDQIPWRDDPLQQRACVTPGRAYNEFPFKRVYVAYALPPDVRLPGTLQTELFFLLTGLWPLDSRPTPKLQGRPYMLRDVAASEDYSIVRPRQEEIDGRLCHVLEQQDGLDRLWLDVDRGTCLVARETFDSDTGRQRERIELGGHREVAPGIWLPSWIQNVQYDYAARSEEQSKRRIVDSRITLIKISANDVDDAAFQFRPAPGSLSYDPDDPDSSLQQTEPGGLDYLDDLSGWLSRYFPAASTVGGDWLGYAGYLAALPFLLVIAFCERKRRATKNLCATPDGRKP